VAPISLLRGAVLGLAAMSLFAAYDILVKFLGSSYSPFQIMFFTSISAVPLVMLQMALDPAPDNFRPKLPRWTIARSVVALLQGSMGVYCFTVLPLAQAYAIFFTMPLMITFLAALFLGEKVGLARAVAAIIGFAGVLIALDPGREALRLDHIIAFAAAFFGAVSYVIMRKTGHIERPAVLIIYPMLFQLVAVAIALPFVYVPMPINHILLTWAMSCLGIAGTYVIVAAYRAAPSAVVAPMQYVQIFWAAIAGAVLFGEEISATTWFGLGLIVATGIYILTSARAQDAATATL